MHIASVDCKQGSNLELKTIIKSNYSFVWVCRVLNWKTNCIVKLMRFHGGCAASPLFHAHFNENCVQCNPIIWWMFRLNADYKKITQILWMNAISVMKWVVDSNGYYVFYVFSSSQSPTFCQNRKREQIYRSSCWISFAQDPPEDCSNFLAVEPSPFLISSKREIVRPETSGRSPIANTGVQ